MQILQFVEKILDREGKDIKEKLKKKREERCIHRHTIETHPNCFRRGLHKKGLWYVEENLRMGFLDIETSNLKANAGFMLTWALKDRGGKIAHSRITKDEIWEGEFDKRLCDELIKELHKYDIIVTYYGTGFDVPFARTRCIYWDLPFPSYGSIYHFDLLYRVRRLLKLHRNSLEAATRFFEIEGKNHVHMGDWQKAAYGDKKALDYVMDHNIEDVKILERLFDKLEDYSKWTKRSI